MREIDESMMSKFNFLDMFMYKIDGFINGVKEAVSDIKDQKQPEPEEVIEVAIKELKEENENLKKRDFPQRVVIKDNLFLCPACSSELKKSDVGFFCKKCGQRISKNLPR